MEILMRKAGVRNSRELWTRKNRERRGGRERRGVMRGKEKQKKNM